jgi:enoyl-CoA hydratase / 3-hydroxyacyl-CoA dehydrogenase
MKTFKTIGVVGAGTMGSALAQKFAQENFQVLLADQSEEQTSKGLKSISGMLAEGVKRKVFTADQVQHFLANITCTHKLADLNRCDLVIEAIYENYEAKSKLFRNLSKIVSHDCVLATNTSSFSVTELAASVQNPGRFIGLHFFYHAAKNRLVEIIPGEQTSPGTFEAVKRFAQLSGKDAITCKDAYGFVVNRFFVPWLNEAVRLHEKGLSRESIDKVCRKVFGIGMGPFELMNATGVPVAYHSQKTLEIFGPLYKVASLLKVQTELGKPWALTAIESHPVEEADEKIIRERMLGIVFFVCSQILDEKICTATAINRGARIGLLWKKGPVDLMRERGIIEVASLLMQISHIYDVQLPSSIGEYFWNTENVRSEKKGNAVTITMDEPEALNALSEQTMHELENHFTAAEKDPQVKTIFITGSGKAFVAGADIRFFVKKIKNDLICDIESFTGYGQKVFSQIERSKKKVVAVINGLALGGGLELALCADVILVTPKAQLAFPETGIGIYPGLGGTQRCTARVGTGLCKYLIYTGHMLSAADAFKAGIADAVIEPGALFGILEGSIPVPARRAAAPAGKWKSLANLFDRYSIEQILANKCASEELPGADLEKIAGRIRQKAPVALKLAEKLISEAKGCESELAHLREIFSTSDALLGLTSIGKKVEYQGR